MKTPNPLVHLIFSISKSVLRIFGCLAAINYGVITLAIFLLIAEIVGILEELF